MDGSRAIGSFQTHPPTSTPSTTSHQYPIIKHTQAAEVHVTKIEFLPPTTTTTTTGAAVLNETELMDAHCRASTKVKDEEEEEEVMWLAVLQLFSETRQGRERNEGHQSPDGAKGRTTTTL